MGIPERRPRRSATQSPVIRYTQVAVPSPLAKAPLNLMSIAEQHPASSSERVLTCEITNIGATDLYINAPQHTVDKTGKWSQLYIQGKFSTPTAAGRPVESLTTQSIYVQDDEPTDAVENDLWVDTNDYSRFDRQEFTATGSDTVADEEVVEFTGSTAISYTLDATGATEGCIKILKNSSTALVTIIGTIDGVANMYLYPLESCELIWNGTDWRMW